MSQASPSLLDSIRQPQDLRNLSIPELQQLAAEMRERIFQAVSKNGGHLASNLGVVDLTVAPNSILQRNADASVFLILQYSF